MRHRIISAILGSLLATGAPCVMAASPEPEEAALEADHSFRSYVETLWPQVRAQGIARRTFDAALGRMQLDWRVLDRANAQPEHELAIGTYVEQLASRARSDAGLAALAHHIDSLRSVEATYGVDRHVVAAIWGIESNFGTAMGDFDVPRALAMLAWKGGKRAEFGRTQFIESLRILQRGDIEPQRMMGSWAGAMGHTQFIPTTYGRHAVDFNRDGRRDIWGTVADALASTANYLKASGWQAGIPWGVEARLPEGFDFTLLDRELPVGDWLSRGVVPAPSSIGLALDDGVIARLLVPAGSGGPAFLVTANFRAILKYNNATPYALAVGRLADRLAGGGDLSRPWPSADRPLRRREREELQSLLIAQGLYKGEIDGVFGDQTKAALLAWQRQMGVVPDAYASERVLSLLKSVSARAEE